MKLYGGSENRGMTSLGIKEDFSEESKVDFTGSWRESGERRGLGLAS